MSIFPRMTSQEQAGGFSLKVEMTDVDGNYRRAEYQSVTVRDEETKYVGMLQVFLQSLYVISRIKMHFVCRCCFWSNTMLYCWY